MSDDLIGRMRSAAERIGLPGETISSGAGHDSAVFAEIGIPTAMLFIRNINGSHNPDEDMDIDDFAAGVSLLLDVVRKCD